ncbi:MAG: hypothetical protein QOG05_3813 [Streptosporangiaceae bacterium]|nr:hypothetical protein [Streptosporangiaceae bacterium]
MSSMIKAGERMWSAHQPRITQCWITQPWITQPRITQPWISWRWRARLDQLALVSERPVLLRSRAEPMSARWPSVYPAP